MSTERFMQKITVHETGSGYPVEPVYGPEDVQADHRQRIGRPGEPPFTRGPFPEMYRTRLWTRRVIAGFGLAKDTNERLKYLMKHGESGISVVPDILTLMGIDGDHPMAENETGSMGFPLTSLQDMEQMFEGIPLDRLSVSFHNPWITAAMNQAQFMVAAEKGGYPPTAIRGSMQNNFLDVFTCGAEKTSPLDLGLRLCLDVIEHSVRHLPNWHPINVNAYDIGEHGTAPHEEIGYVLGMAVTYVDGLVARGLEFDQFAPRFSFAMGAAMDFFETACKMRALRRMWATLARERWGARDPKSMRAIIAGHTAGYTMQAQQPLNNIARGAIEALGAVLGGCQALDISCFDEPFSLPTEQSARVALATQYVIAHEAGVCPVADPLGGSYYVEWLTDKIESEATALLNRIEAAGGMPELIRTGQYQAALEAANFRRYSKIMNHERVVVGVNEFRVPAEEDFRLEVHRNPPEASRQHAESVTRLKETRDPEPVKRTLAALREEAGTGHNLMPALIEATRAYATVGECAGVIRQAYGLAYDPFGFTTSPID